MFTPWFVAAIVVAYGIALFAPRVALAHAVLVSSQPAVNSTVSGPEVAVLLKYNSRVDMEHSTLTLLAPDGRVEKVAIESEPAARVAVCQVDRTRQRSLCVALAGSGYGWTHHARQSSLPSRVET